jgi:hypothetical protein
MSSQYVSTSSEYGEISLKEEIEKTFIFHVSKENNKFIYFIVNPTEELQELLSGLQPRGGHLYHRRFFSDLSPSEIKGNMFSGIFSFDVSGSGYNSFPVIAIPYSVKKLLLEKEWEFDDDSCADIKLSYTYKSPLAQFNYGYTHKKMRIQFKNSYLVIPHFAASMTPIGRTTSKYYKRFELLELTKEYAVVLLIYEKNRSIPGADASLDIEGTFTWHISGPTVLPPPPILDSDVVIGELLDM